VANYVLGLQAGVANGNEATFDGQPMEAGVHLRWSFVAALGFPPGGFWLCRRLSTNSDDKRIPPPELQPCDKQTGDGKYTYAATSDTTAGRGLNPPCSTGPAWGKQDAQGWQCWGVPFTPPITKLNWPARYFGAPNPATAPLITVEIDDVKEARMRLGALKLAAGLTTAQEDQELLKLRGELFRLVFGYPTILLGNVPMPASPAGANAPRLNISVMQELLFLALDPYFARVMGLYFVDKSAQPGTKYDYAIVGFWGGTPSQNPVVYPALAPAAPLARGSFTYNGVNIQAGANGTSLWRWMKLDPQGAYAGQVDPAAPLAAQTAANAAVQGISQANQPPAMLMATTLSGGFPFYAPPPQVTFGLAQTGPTVDIELAGQGTVQALSGGNVVATASFNSTQLTLVTVTSSSPVHAIDQLVVTGTGGIFEMSECVAIGGLRLHPVGSATIGTQFAIVHAPGPIHAIPAPDQPFTTYRHRQADINTATLKLVNHSLYDVTWPTPATPSPQTGNPVSDPMNLPPPTQPIGFVAQRSDGANNAGAESLPGWITTRSAPTPSGSPIATPTLYRLVDSLRPDPVTGWSHRIAAFDLFGVRSPWSPWSTPRGVEKIAPPPTSLRILQFDNTPNGGGAAAAGGSSWDGGTLVMLTNWSASRYMLYPDGKSARATVEGIDTNGNSTGVLTTYDLPIKPPAIHALTVASVQTTAQPDGNGYTVDIQTQPALSALGGNAPSQVLMVTLPDGSQDRYVVRPLHQTSSSSSPVVARFVAGDASRIIASTSDYIGQPAYLVSGYGTKFAFPVPVTVPIDQKTVRFQVSLTASLEDPFQAGDVIVDPNGVNASRPMPQSAILVGQAAQRLTPPAPPIPTHSVDHLYYDPADATGMAGVTLPFTTPAGSGISGYLLERAPVRSIALSDVQRRIALIKAGTGDVTDNNPASPGGTPRPDLAAWIASLSTWINCYNALHAASFTVNTVLDDANAQRAFIEHFYNGLLDDELRALGDVPGNSPGYVRVTPRPVLPATALSDQVLGTGYGRTLYRLSAVNAAGSPSDTTTGSAGPWYTRIVTPPRPPVLYKVQPTESSILVAWALDANPDVAGYLVYRGPATGSLADLRFFGADWTHPAALTALPTVACNYKVNPPLAFVQGTGTPPNIDTRIVGFVPDPRLCARDYQGSDMAEIALPAGPPPDEINGIYRLTDFSASAAPLSQPGFNYWTTPTVGGIAQMVTDSPTQTRLTGLRIGLGRGVPVVVVATWSGQVRVLGQVPNRRAAFIDGVNGSNTPLDPNAIAAAPAPSATAPNAYAVVSVDIFGNRSAPSSIFAGQMLVLATTP
jgi:hypothetical protein